jgi:hypothetical protein
MSTSFALREIERLDPQRDHQRIVRLSYCYEFPMEAAIVSIIVLLRSFGSPRISGILDASGEWSRSGAMRSANLVRSVASLVSHGYESPVGQSVITRMNAAHVTYRSENDEFVYIIARFVFEPIAWNARFGWRPYCAREKESLFLFWTAVGRRMHLRDIPETRESLFLFMCRYAQAHCRPDPVNRRLYLSFREVLAGWFPAPVRPLVRWVLPRVLDHDLRDHLMIPASADTGRAAVGAVLRARSRLVSLLPKRIAPYPFRANPPFLYGSGPRLREAEFPAGHDHDARTAPRSVVVQSACRGEPMAEYERSA